MLLTVGTPEVHWDSRTVEQLTHSPWKRANIRTSEHPQPLSQNHGSNSALLLRHSLDEPRGMLLMLVKLS